MADNEPTISMAGINAPPLYRLVEDGDKTVIVTADTNTPMWVINGKIGGDTVETMTTAERTAITPEAGQLIYDTDEGALYVGDGATAGGIPVGSGGGGGGGTPATVKDIMTGSGGSKILNVTNIRAALTAGQAVDVTSQPDGVTGDYKGTFTVTGSLGFASFPKYASGLNYLMIADLTATTSGTVTPSGTWLDGTSAAKSLAGGTSTRVAMLFNAANKAKFTFSSTGSVSVTNCREYEVTACSAEAVAYIAQIASPDAFAAYYLVKPDMVQPWTAIIDMGSSPAVTIASGLSYKLNAATGTHQLTVDTCPAGYDGRDAIIRITLGGSGVIQAVSPLQLGGALVPYAVNNCVVRFRDGEAVLLVEDTLAGYVVTVNAGTGEGSLPYGLAATGVPYIAFSPSTDGIPVDLSGATTAAEEVTVVGNGYEETILTGSITCTSKTTVANLALQDVVVNGGVMTLGDAYVPSGSTVAVSGGGLAIEKVTGAGSDSVIDLGGTHVPVVGSAYVSGCTLTNGNASSGGCFYALYNTMLSLKSVTLTSNYSSRGAAAYIEGATVYMNDVTISGNSPGNRTVYMKSGMLYMYGSNVLNDDILGQSGSVTLTSSTVLDLTGNTNATPIAPGGGITFEAGGQTILHGSSGGVVSSAIFSCSENQNAYTIGKAAEIALTETYYIIRPKEMRLANCTLYNASTTEQVYLIFSTAGDAAKIFTIENCDIGKDNETYGIQIGGSTGTINCNNVSFRGKSKVYQNNSQTVTLNLSGTTYIHGLSGNIALRASVVNIAANTYLDTSDCESLYVMQGTITFGAGVKIKKYGTDTYVDLVEGGTAGTCYRIERNGNVAYSA